MVKKGTLLTVESSTFAFLRWETLTKRAKNSKISTDNKLNK